MNEADVPFHEHGKSRPGIFAGVLFQQIGIGRVGHSPVICVPKQKGDKEFFTELLVIESVKIIDVDGNVGIGRMRSSGRSKKVADEH
jgi:hypothetical protein